MKTREKNIKIINEATRAAIIRQMIRGVEKRARKVKTREKNIKIINEAIRALEEAKESPAIVDTPRAYYRIIREIKGALIEGALIEAKGNATEAAEFLGIGRRALYDNFLEGEGGVKAWREQAVAKGRLKGEL